ncbi:hypothetical protein LIER_19254 [Lithospermum erythrorhizon]|uniref:Uncharacterized protein n=1 Tax=Lithospermum erythrorhizon TaxID=34254 RepID=A0AAV3QKX0_LITER
MAFSSPKSCSLFFMFTLLLSSLFLVVSSCPSTPFSREEDSCNFDYVFSFGVGKTSVSSNGLVLPHLDATSSDHIQGAAFSAPKTFIMKQDFYLQHGLPPHQESGSTSLDSQVDHFLDFLVGSSHELQHTLIIINHPGLMDYKHSLQVRSETIVLDLVPEIVTEIKNSLRRLLGAGASNIVVSGLRPESLFGLEILADVHRYHLYQAVVELRVEFPEAHISHLDYIRTMPKGKDHLFSSLEVPEACQAFLVHKGHLL